MSSLPLKSAIALALVACGGPRQTSGASTTPTSPPVVESRPPSMDDVASAPPLPDASVALPFLFRARLLPLSPMRRPVAWSHGALVSCPDKSVVCQNDCIVVASGKSVARVDGPNRTPIALPGDADLASLSMSADCKRAAFQVASAQAATTYETWDLATQQTLRRSLPWPVAGGMFSAELVPSGTFLRWSHNRGVDRYEEISSGVKGPDIGLATQMSPDERFVFIGGGVLFARDDTPSELVRAKDGRRVYAIPKAENTRLDGVFCATGNLLATIDDKGVTLRTTDDAKPLARLPLASRVVFSPDGSQLAATDATGVRLYALERCQGETCAPITECMPRASGP